MIVDSLWLLAIGLGLVALGYWLRTTAFYAWMMYGGTPLWRPGLLGNHEVMTLRCRPGGVRVGIGLNATDETTAFTVSAADAERLADLLVQAADAFEAQAAPRR